MSVRIGLAYNNQDPRTIPKIINVRIDKAAELKDPTNLIDPVFIVDYDAEILQMNYCCFNAENTPTTEGVDRYYFIKSIEPMPGGRLAIQCHEDVLATYATKILTSSGTIDRTEDRSQINYFLYDPEVKPYQYTRTWTKSFSPVFPPQSFANVYLTTIG